MIYLLLILATLSPEKINYSPNYKLTWADFKAPARNGEALSSTAISYDIEVTDGVSKVKVYCEFYKKESYPPKLKTAYTLNHEQRHFDITYIYACKFKKLIQGVTNEQEVKAIYDKIISEWDACQEQYDNETDHSIDEGKQEEWDRKIDKQLRL